MDPLVAEMEPAKSDPTAEWSTFRCVGDFRKLFGDDSLILVLFHT
jgi:hypothetical protein